MSDPRSVHRIISFPPDGAWRMHRAPTQLSRQDSRPRDRFDDPANEYRVRYFASNLRGAYLEVLDHFRPNMVAENALSQVPIVGVDILETEPAGLVPERWLSAQRIARGKLPSAALFANLGSPDLLAELQIDSRVQAALHTRLARASLGAKVRLDDGTVRLVGPVGRGITQAVSRAIYDRPEIFAGISYFTRFDGAERCWAIFDDRISVTFADEQALDSTDADHTDPLADVASMYALRLPVNWQS